MSPSHAVAVIGGATAGAEVARKLADRGAEVTVFDMNPRPFGKIEDGLPRWHRALRDKEYASITDRLSSPSIHFVPSTKIGRDLSFDALTKDWGFSAVVLACGAWRDRPLPITGAEAYEGKGLIYQNPFIIAFNHSEEANFSGRRFKIEDGALVLGGGLASIDVCKLLMLETVKDRLERRGIRVDIEEMEKKGIPATLEEHQLSLAALEVKGCTLFYRRRAEDMPLMEAPEGATPERLQKVEDSRKKILGKAMEKFGFAFEPLSMPEGLITEGDRLVGLKFQRAKVEGKKLVGTGEHFERRGAYIVSSIGSIPEPMPGLSMKGELFPFTDMQLGRLEGYPTVFSAGNVVTGKGNIIASRKHATLVADEMIERFLGLAEGGHAGEEAIHDAIQKKASAEAAAVAGAIQLLPTVSAADLEKSRQRVAERQRAVGYSGDLNAWLKSVAPRPAHT
ncbi:MAG: FAD-dependent oxidoreductase [Myxococcota bacterium]